MNTVVPAMSLQLKLCVLAVISVVVSVSFMYLSDYHQMCGKDHVKDVCHQFEQNMIAGSLCQDLCQTKTITSHTCLSTEPEKAVYKGMWQDKEIILKMRTTDKMESYSFSNLQTKEDHKREISATVNMLFGECENCSVLTEKLADIADVDSDGQLSLAETKTMVTLLRTPEPSMLLVLNGSQHVLKMYGYCGTLYAVEKLPVIADNVFGYTWNFIDFAVLPSLLEPLEELLKKLNSVVYNSLKRIDIFKQRFDPFLDGLKHFLYRKVLRVRTPSLSERFKFSLSLLDTILAMSSNPYGMFQSCDSHLGNFGLSQNFEVKMIDNDQTHPIHHLENILGEMRCESDRDCRIGDFHECLSSCNISKGLCTSVLEKQNLQNICADSLPLVFENIYQDLEDQNTKNLICLEKSVKNLAMFCLNLPSVKTVSDLQKNVETVKQMLLNISLGEFDCV